MRPSRRTVAVVAGIALAIAGTGTAVYAATGGSAVPIACPAGQPIVLTPGESGDAGTWACTVLPTATTVTEVVPSPYPSPVPTTVTQTVTQTVTASPSATSSPSPTASVGPSPTVSPTPTPSGTPTATTGAGCPAYPAMPDASCTGYAHTGVTLRDCPNRITAPGTYDGCRFRGTLTVASSGVTVTRSLVQSGHVEGSPWYDLRGVVLQDVTVVGAGNDGSAAMGNNNYTCRRCDISGGLRGFGIGSNVVIEDSYAHDFWVQPRSQRDSASVHQTAASTHGGAHIRITHSTLYCRSDGYACSSGVSLYSEDAPGIDDVLIEKSYLATDAGYGLMFASLTSGKPYGITNTRVVDCVFGPSEYGPVANFPRSQSGNVWSGNRLASGTGDLTEPAQ